MPDDSIADPRPSLAALRRELKEARAERDAALAREAAVAEILGVINASPGDLTPVFEAILEKAMALCGAEFGSLTVNDADSLRTVAIRGAYPPALVEFYRNNPRSGTPGSIAERIRAGEPVIHVLDLADDDVYRRGDPHRRALVDI